MSPTYMIFSADIISLLEDYYYDIAAMLLYAALLHVTSIRLMISTLRGAHAATGAGARHDARYAVQTSHRRLRRFKAPR